MKSSAIKNPLNLPIAHEQSNLSVGKQYLVAHAFLEYDDKNFTDGATGTSRTYVPIIPNLHTDPQLGIRERHYHIDGRFPISQKMQNRLNIVNGETSHIIAVDSKFFLYRFIKIVYRSVKCVGSNTGLPMHRLIAKYPTHVERTGYLNWYKQYIGKSCAGKKCPHYGATMQKKGDLLVCPLHGLTAECKTKVIIQHPIASKLEVRPADRTLTELLNEPTTD